MPIKQEIDLKITNNYRFNGKKHNLKLHISYDAL